MTGAAGEVARRAEALARGWDALRGQHVGHAGGCGCGAPIIELSVGGWERAIVGFLFDRYGAAPEAAAIFGAEGPDAGLASLIAMLPRLADADLADRVAGDIGRTFASLSRQVGRPFSQGWAA